MIKHDLVPLHKPSSARGSGCQSHSINARLLAAGIESILGLRMQGAFVHLDPCIPKSWPKFEITVQYRSARYEIIVENPEEAGQGVSFAELDGVTIVERPLRLPLLNDGITHHLKVRLG
jgi:cyclic beta-1,2-glucan synthetase